MENETDFKINRARIQLQAEQPFFAYLSLYLKFCEDKDTQTFSIDADGNLRYNSDFALMISEKELIAVLCHEILHLALEHLDRRGNFDRDLWNRATDLVVNTLLKQNNFELPRGCIVAEYYDKYSFKSMNGKIIEIQEVSKKTAEEIYKIFEKHLPKGKEDYKNGSYTRFDEHKESEEYRSEEQVERNIKKWKDRVQESYIAGKYKGNVPKGLDRYIDNLYKNKVDWRYLLEKYVQNIIPTDYTYAKPHKKSNSVGYYMPDYIKEKIDILVAVDLSGSIGKEQIKEFLSEIVAIARGYQDKIDMTLLTHDIDVQNDYRIVNVNERKIVELKMNGGGGTSHRKVLEHIKEKYPRTTLAIFFTDGYSDIESINTREYSFEKLFIINENGKKMNIKDKVIQL